MSALEILKGTIFFLITCLAFFAYHSNFLWLGCPCVRGVETKAKKDGHLNSKW